MLLRIDSAQLIGLSQVHKAVRLFRSVSENTRSLFLCQPSCEQLVPSPAVWNALVVDDSVVVRPQRNARETVRVQRVERVGCEWVRTTVVRVRRNQPDIGDVLGQVAHRIQLPE